MDLYTVIILAFGVAFLVSVLDYFVDLGIWRAAIAFLLSALGVVSTGWPWTTGLTCALAASFLAMFLLQVIERINFRAVGRTR